jgi:hypothetical protein
MAINHALKIRYAPFRTDREVDSIDFSFIVNRHKSNRCQNIISPKMIQFNNKKKDRHMWNARWARRDLAEISLSFVRPDLELGANGVGLLIGLA